MKKIIVIGVAGQAESGKDTVSNYLCARYGFFRLAFADGIKSSINDMNGPTWQISKEVEKAGKTMTRWGQQILGTECRLDIGVPDHWINHVLIKIRYLNHYNPIKRYRFILPDFRHHNEKDKLNQRLYDLWEGRFDLWKINRDLIGLQGEEGKHTSETEVKEVTGTNIDNNSSFENLYAIIDLEIRKLLNADN